ncbi:hypothetical protein FRB99_005405 [Tulasnella sp. 403]|nr:hypothetical protein FRB99_005405 [Tulasnella sp. 403]
MATPPLDVSLTPAVHDPSPYLRGLSAPTRNTHLVAPHLEMGLLPPVSIKVEPNVPQYSSPTNTIQQYNTPANNTTSYYSSSPTVSPTCDASWPVPACPLQESPASSTTTKRSPSPAETAVEGFDGPPSEIVSYEDAMPKASHAKKQPAGHIKRPKNAFILYRSNFVRTGQLGKEVESDHRKISKIVGRIWNNLSPEEKAVWEERARKEKEEHKRQYPDYRYSPINRKDPSGTTSGIGSRTSSRTGLGPVRRRRQGGTGTTQDDRRCRTIADMFIHGKQGDEIKENLAKKNPDDFTDSCGDDDADDSDFEETIRKSRAKGRKVTSKSVLPSHAHLAVPFPATGQPLLSTHAMTTRRRSSSTPLPLPAVSTIPGPSSRRPKTHIRAFSDLAAYEPTSPSTAEVPIASSSYSTKGRTTNNSMSSMMNAKREHEEPIFNNPIAPGFQQRLLHEKKLRFHSRAQASQNTASRVSSPLARGGIPINALPIATPRSCPRPFYSPSPSVAFSSPTLAAGSHNASPSPQPQLGNPFQDLGLGLDGLANLTPSALTAEDFAFPSFTAGVEYAEGLLDTADQGQIMGLNAVPSIPTTVSAPEDLHQTISDQISTMGLALSVMPDIGQQTSIFDPNYSLTSFNPGALVQAPSSPDRFALDDWLHDAMDSSAAMVGMSPMRPMSYPAPSWPAMPAMDDDLAAYRRGLGSSGSRRF